MTDPRRRVPRTDQVLAALSDLVDAHGATAVKDAVVRAQQRCRAGDLDPDDVAGEARADLLARPTTSLRPLVNATGVVLHTNIGRAALSTRAREALTVAAGHVDVEYDVATGRRARRGRGTLDALRRSVPAAGDALVVNNGAAALVLTTTALAVAAGRPEVVISRGEVVEIGDGFRLHELIASTGARLVEVGTTNRTHLDDYADAVGPDTGLLLKVHPSNFVVRGFTRSVPVSDLAALTARLRTEHDCDVPLVVDIGSGLLTPEPVLPDEPDAQTALTQGADLVTASGDKLLGGPQAGLLLGRSDLVHAVRRHPLARAVRVDKLTLAAMEATLLAPDATPTWAALHVDLVSLRRRTDTLAAQLRAHTAHATLIEVVDSEAAVGGGGAPEVVLPSVALALDAAWAGPLRAAGVIGRVVDGRLLLDLRTVDPAQDDRLGDMLMRVLSEGQ